MRAIRSADLARDLNMLACTRPCVIKVVKYFSMGRSQVHFSIPGSIGILVYLFIYQESVLEGEEKKVC